MAAKTREARRHLMMQFQGREVTKRYVAVVEGAVEKDEGTIDLEIDGREAFTMYRVVERTRGVGAKRGSGHLTTLELFPRQGRTHHLRIHCSQVGRLFPRETPPHPTTSTRVSGASTDDSTHFFQRLVCLDIVRGAISSRVANV
jgi:hypothetical protein